MYDTKTILDAIKAYAKKNGALPNSLHVEIDGAYELPVLLVRTAEFFEPSVVLQAVSIKALLEKMK